MCVCVYVICALQESDYRTYTELGKQTLGGHKQNLVPTRTREKGAVTLQETDPDMPVTQTVQESTAEALTVACCSIRGTEYVKSF